jgi:coenzyme Q-binding protein COQ10
MPTHAEQRFLPYSPAQLFALVSDVESYPQFLPWCLSCRITHRENNIIYADLIIGYKMIREKFGSKVTLGEPHSIHVEYLHGPMKYLSNHWKFIEAEQGGCIVDFYVDFEFRNPILQRMMGAFFNEIVRRMVSAFEMRAKALYG